MLLDLLTVFFLVAGSWLLWLNLRRRRGVVLTKMDDDHQPPARADEVIE